jgi:hypothetical protein
VVDDTTERDSTMATIKALSLTQPWGTLVASGAKRIETRSWKTSYRGPLAIHAAKGLPKDTLALFFTEPFASTLRRNGIKHPSDMPRGAIVATCTLVDCIPTESIRGSLSENELAFGDYSDGRWAWVLEDVQALSQPVPVKGALGLWEWQP